MPRTLVLASALLAPVLVGCAPPQPVLVSPKGIETPLPKPKAVAKTDAAAAGVAGRTVVAYCVNREGATEDITVKESFTPDFDALAVRTVERWTYEPATRDGTPERHCTEATIEFRP
ncbi:MAG: TonB family protein [Nannocystaceae bacterium]|nr:energy transducer TonB [bacterium]